MRILIFNWKDSLNKFAGGAEYYTAHVSEALVRFGHEVTIFCAAEQGLPKKETVNGVKIIRRGTKYSVYREAKKFYLGEKCGLFDVIIDQINTRPFMCPKWVRNAPVIALAHQVCREIWFAEFHFIFAVFGRYFLEPNWLNAYKNIRTITVSNSSSDSLKHYGLNNVVIFPEGYDSLVAELPHAKNDHFTFVFVGRLSANKRPQDAIDAFRIFRQKFPDSKLEIIGSGPIEDSLKEAPNFGVTFHGRISNSERNEIIRKSHGLLLTSIREGWGLVVTEAAQMGTVSFGYDVAGIRDSVSASGGFLSGPSPRKLGELLIEFFEDDTYETKLNPKIGGVIRWEELARLWEKELLDAISNFKISIH